MIFDVLAELRYDSAFLCFAALGVFGLVKKKRARFYVFSGLFCVTVFQLLSGLLSPFGLLLPYFSSDEIASPLQSRIEGRLYFLLLHPAALLGSAIYTWCVLGRIGLHAATYSIAVLQVLNLAWIFWAFSWDFS